MSHTPVYDIEFEARPADGVILCHRLTKGQRNGLITKYVKGGIYPEMRYLTPVHRRSWTDAFAAMGWGS